MTISRGSVLTWSLSVPFACERASSMRVRWRGGHAFRLAHRNPPTATKIPPSVSHEAQTSPWYSSVRARNIPAIKQHGGRDDEQRREQPVRDGLRDRACRHDGLLPGERDRAIDGIGGVGRPVAHLVLSHSRSGLGAVRFIGPSRVPRARSVHAARDHVPWCRSWDTSSRQVSPVSATTTIERVVAPAEHEDLARRAGVHDRSVEHECGVDAEGLRLLRDAGGGWRRVGRRAVLAAAVRPRAPGSRARPRPVAATCPRRRPCRSCAAPRAVRARSSPIRTRRVAVLPDSAPLRGARRDARRARRGRCCRRHHRRSRRSRLRHRDRRRRATRPRPRCTSRAAAVAPHEPRRDRRRARLWQRAGNERVAVRRRERGDRDRVACAAASASRRARRRRECRRAVRARSRARTRARGRPRRRRRRARRSTARPRARGRGVPSGWSQAFDSLDDPKCPHGSRAHPRARLGPVRSATARCRRGMSSTVAISA